MDINYYKQYEPLFGSWYITEEIGKGAYGHVYIVERHEFGIVYKSALKALTIPQDKNEIKSAMAEGMSELEATQYYKGLVQNIVNEFIMMSKLKGNSHIVSYEDHVLIEHENDIGWDILIRMELLTPLVEHIANRTLTENEVIKLGIDLCKALEFCRKYDIIHRDIKPENIFIAPSGDYKIGDFGIAKTVEKTLTGLSKKGTYTYMAPEVYKGEAYGATVDIYSLGIVMYKLLNNNRTPFIPQFPLPITYDDREESLARRIKGEKIPEPESGSEELKRIILKACSFNASDRYASALEMRRALEKLFYGNSWGRQTQYEIFEANTVEDALSDRKTEEDAPAAKKTVNKKRIAILAVIVALAVSGIVYTFVPKIPEDISGIKAEETIYIGDTLKPHYIIEPDKFAKEKITFTVDDDSIAAVNEKGQITAEKLGKTVMTVSAAGYSEKVVINVIAKVTKISNVDKSIVLTEGETKKLEPELSPKEFAEEKITYKIMDKSIASVNSNGEITAKSTGTTKMTISAGGCSVTIDIAVEEYVAPAYTTRYDYNPGYSNGSGASKNSKISNPENPSGNSGSDNGFFDDSDDEYF